MEMQQKYGDDNTSAMYVDESYAINRRQYGHMAGPITYGKHLFIKTFLQLILRW